MRPQGNSSRFKETLSPATGHNAQPQSIKRPPSQKKYYVVYINLTSENGSPPTSEGSLPSSHPILISPQSPTTKMVPRSVLAVRHIQTYLTESISKEYFLKLNKAIEDLNMFYTYNLRLINLNQQLETQNRYLQKLFNNVQNYVNILKQSQHNSPFRQLLEYKESQVKNYCTRIKIIEEKLQNYETERSANNILANYFTHICTIFGYYQLGIEYLREKIEIAVERSKLYSKLMSYQHQNNEYLQRIIYKLNEITFTKDDLELKLISQQEQNEQLRMQLDHLTKNFGELSYDNRSLRNALDASRQEVDGYKAQINRITTMPNENTNLIKTLQLQLGTAHRDCYVLKKETNELRKVVANYKDALQEAYNAHTMETYKMSQMLADLRKSYHEANVKLKVSQTTEEDAYSLKYALNEAQKTIRNLMEQQRLNATEDSRKIKAKYYNMYTEIQKLYTYLRMSERYRQQMARTLSQQRITIEYLQNQRVKEPPEERRQFESELAVKTAQFAYLQEELEMLRDANSRLQAENNLNSNRLHQCQMQIDQYEQQQYQQKYVLNKYSLEITENLSKIRDMMQYKFNLYNIISELKIRIYDISIKLEQTTLKLEQNTIKNTYNQQTLENYQYKTQGLQRAVSEKEKEIDSLQKALSISYNTTIQIKSTLIYQLEREKQKSSILEEKLTYANRIMSELYTKLLLSQKHQDQWLEERRKLQEYATRYNRLRQEQAMETETLRNTNRKLESEVSTLRLTINEQIFYNQSNNRYLSIQLGHLNQKHMYKYIEVEKFARYAARLKIELQNLRESTSKYINILTEYLKKYQKVNEQYEYGIRYRDGKIEHYEFAIKYKDSRIYQILKDLQYLEGDSTKLKRYLQATTYNRQRQIESLNSEYESKLIKMRTEIESEEVRSNQQRHSYYEHIEKLNAVIEKKYTEKQELLENMAAVEQKFNNMRLIYGQVEEAATQYKNQFEAVKAYNYLREAYLRQMEANTNSRMKDLMEVQTRLTEMEGKVRIAEQQHEKYEGRIRDMQRVIDELNGKQSEGYRKMAEEVNKKEAYYEEELSRLAVRLNEANDKERNAYIARYRQLALENEETQRKNRYAQKNLTELQRNISDLERTNHYLQRYLQRNSAYLQRNSSELQKANNYLNRYNNEFQKINTYLKRSISRLNQEISDLKQQQSLANLDYESKQQYLKYRLKITQNKFYSLKQDVLSRYYKLMEQIKSLKDDNYALQAEKINITTKLQMAVIKNYEIESYTQQLRAEIYYMRTQKRMILLDMNTGSMTDSLGRSNSLNNSALEISRGLELSDGILRPVTPDSDMADEVHMQYFNKKVRPTTTHNNLEGLTINYSKYYEENLKNLKQQHQQMQQQMYKQSENFYTKDRKLTVSSGKNIPNIPKSPKMFPTSYQHEHRESISRSVPQHPTHGHGLSIKNAMSTQSLNVETEPSEKYLPLAMYTQDMIVSTMNKS